MASGEEATAVVVRTTSCIRMTVGYAKKLKVGLPNYSSVEYEASVFETWEIAAEDTTDKALDELRIARAKVLREHVKNQVPKLSDVRESNRPPEETEPVQYP